MHTGSLETAHATRGATPSRSGPDRCPTTTALHRADDGLIARVRMPGGRITAEQARILATVAAPNDSIEITSRGNLQLRRLSDAGADRAAAAIADAGLTPRPAHDRARTIVASPFIGRRHGAGLDDAFITALDRAICATEACAAVSGRILTAVDSGLGNPLATQADLLIRWQRHTGRVQLVLGGREAALLARADAPAAAAALLGRLAEATTTHGVWRATELPDYVLEGLTRYGAPVEIPAFSLAAPAIGCVRQADGRTAVRAVAPLGRLTPEQLGGLAAQAEQRHTDVRIDPLRGITLVDLAVPDVAETVGALRQLGLLTSPADPGIGLTACAGRDCTRTEVDVRAAARLRMAERRPGDPREHLVGCDRRCGAPAGGDTVVVAAPGDTPERLAGRAAERLASRQLPTGSEAAR